MNKKVYQQPVLHIVTIEFQYHLLNGTGVHDDDSQNPGNAMSRRRNRWDDEDDWKE